MKSHNSNKAVLAALIGNTLISIFKYIISFITGSAGMLAEAVHSTADCLNQVFLLISSKQTKRERDEKHSMGYGRVEYFWGLLVAVFLFFIGAMFSIYEGLHKLHNTEPLQHVWISLVVLGVASVIEFFSFRVAYIEFKKTNKNNSGIINSLKDSTSVSLIIILLEDFAALLGLGIVFLTTLLSLKYPIFDAIGSLLVGGLLLIVSIFMCNEMRKFIIGESIDRKSYNNIKSIINKYEVVNHINNVQSMSVGKGEYLLLASVDFNNDISCYDLEDIIEDMKLEIRKQHNNITNIYIEPRDCVRNNKF